MSLINILEPPHDCYYRNRISIRKAILWVEQTFTDLSTGERMVRFKNIETDKFFNVSLATFLSNAQPLFIQQYDGVKCISTGNAAEIDNIYLSYGGEYRVAAGAYNFPLDEVSNPNLFEIYYLRADS